MAFRAFWSAEPCFYVPGEKHAGVYGVQIARTNFQMLLTSKTNDVCVEKDAHILQN